MRDIIIREGTIAEVVALSILVPEFFQPYSEATYKERLQNKPHLILIAEVDGELAGFKVGYQKETNTEFYSWMGGVLASYRRMGIATKLAEKQESWAKKNGYDTIKFKTRNRLTKMLHFGLHRGFMITDVIKNEKLEEYRIVLQKPL